MILSSIHFIIYSNHNSGIYIFVCAQDQSIFNPLTKWLISILNHLILYKIINYFIKTLWLITIYTRYVDLRLVMPGTIYNNTVSSCQLFVRHKLEMTNNIISLIYRLSIR
jgi:hypothetical protein